MKNTSRDATTGRYARTVVHAELDAAAARLRVAGNTYDQIAAQLGLYDKTAAYRAVQRALTATVQEPAAELRQLELARLDAMWREVLAVLHRQHVTVSNGRIVRGEDGEAILDDGPVLNAVDRLLRIQDRRAKLLGLDAPKRIEVLTLDAIDAEIERLTAELAQLDSADPGPAAAAAGAAPAES